MPSNMSPFVSPITPRLLVGVMLTSAAVYVMFSVPRDAPNVMASSDVTLRQQDDGPGVASVPDQTRIPDQTRVSDETKVPDQVASPPASSPPASSPPASSPPAEFPPCGEVCQYTGALLQDKNNTYYTPLRKHIDCRVVMRRMAYRDQPVLYPPPDRPPDSLLGEYTQHGQNPITEYKVLTAFNPDKSNPRPITRDTIDGFVAKSRRGENTNAYADSGCLLGFLQRYRSQIQGRDGVVIGTLGPWLEGMLLAQDVRHITTLEYSNIVLDHPQLQAHSPYSFAENYLKGEVRQFDFAASYSSLEHSGLGRYGDPLNPHGDMEAMAQIWCSVAPGGLLILGVPRSMDGSSHIVWNAHRVYGPARLQHLTANWDLVEYDDSHCGTHVVLVLRRAEGLPG